MSRRRLDDADFGAARQAAGRAVEVDFIRHVVAEGKRKKRVKSESDDEGDDDEHEDLVELGECKVKTCTDQRIDTGRAIRLHLGKACVLPS